MLVPTHRNHNQFILWKTKSLISQPLTNQAFYLRSQQTGVFGMRAFCCFNAQTAHMNIPNHSCSSA
ncbi:hypothetical protein RE6C_00686 [Rhodopirellula europaea 6C]|uniref:Uncharacterized protein n=1 Tax=Rhodopirellula europaea 6C TaxID=1263867 RepID=M2B8V3_9BACT|nr:hypothetical protein RE6C_00686 [Rhodopirellula europaea 6C]